MGRVGVSRMDIRQCFFFKNLLKLHFCVQKMYAGLMNLLALLFDTHASGQILTEFGGKFKTNFKFCGM